MAHKDQVNGGLVVAIPQLGQVLIVEKDGEHINVGQVKSVAYEEGGGTGFNVETTGIDGGEFYVRHMYPELSPGLKRVRVAASAG